LKAFLESVLASARVSIVVTDEQLRVRRLNPAARSAFRLGLSEAEGKPLQELALWEPLRSHEQAIRRAATGGEGLHLSAVSVTRSDGTELILDVDVEPLRDPVRATPVTGLVVMGTDVTERERARQRLGATEHLAAVGHLAAQVAHEVRNPLSSLGLNCELLEDEVSVLEGTRGTEAKRLLKAMGREIDRLAALTEGYLRHARLARGPARAVDLNAAVEELASLVRDDLRRKGVTLTLMCSPRAGRVKADPSGLRQALLNLVRNAVEAVSGHPQAQVRVQTARDGDRVTLAVQDNGPGVPEELRERIFQPFFTTRESGSGLGLSVSRQSLEEHGGTLRCEVAPGGGARFVASLVGVDESSPPLPAPLPEDDEVVVAPEVPPPGHAPDAAPRNKH
jgi:PAS domain S-box-containing protein